MTHTAEGVAAERRLCVAALSLRVAGLRPETPPLLTRLLQGPLDATTGEVGDPLG